MSVAPGTRLGPYEITAKLGEGGMGEVWRARDTKLDRDVAIKVLPAAFTADEERLARFEREAKLLAQLHHPNIASIFGMEESGETKALVMELVEGPTLADRLEQGSLPIDESLSVARQIAEALEEAHEKGIVHRDLKPQNVKAPKEGKVKVLDFGLAKAMDPVGTASGAPSGSQLAASPTLTLGATVQGVILGTAAYMAPEQAAGAPVDRRADVWSFGVVLYEMLSGRRLFEGETVSHVLAGVLKDEPDFARLPDDVPPAIRRLLRRCLRKKPRERLHSIADARIVLEEVLRGETGEPAKDERDGSPRSSPVARLLPWAAAALFAALWLGGLAFRSGPAAAPEPARTIPIDLGLERIQLAYGAAAVLSPDGRRMAWVAGRDSSARLYVRDLDRLESRVIPGTEGAQDPVFSPDGDEIAFFSGTSLFKVPVAGGTPVRLAEVALPRGLAWTDDGTIVYNRDVADGLWKISASGGVAERLTRPDPEAQERSHRWPKAIPGTHRVLYLNQGLGEIYEEGKIERLDLETGERTVVHRGGTYPRVTRDGVLLYARDRAVWAARLADDASGIMGAPVRALDPVGYSQWSGGAQFDVSKDGTLLYSTGRSDEEVEIAWFDPETATTETVVSEPGFYYTPALGPDGSSLALQLYTVGRSDLWIFDLAGGGRRRLTFGGRDEYPVWSPDGGSIVYSRGSADGAREMVSIRVDGSGEPHPVAPGEHQRIPTSWSPDGTLLFTELAAETSADVWMAWPANPERPAEPLYRTPANEGWAEFSPDGRWIAYESDESGTSEVYVRAFPDGTGRWQVSDRGGSRPGWSKDGRAIYFWSGAALVRRSVSVDGEVLSPGRLSTFPIERPVLRTEDSGYVVDSRGRVLLLPFAADNLEPARTVIAFGWADELRRRLEGGR